MSKHASAPDRWIFAGLLAVLVWMPIPWGSKPPAAASLFGLLVAALALGRLTLEMRGRVTTPPLPRAARWVMALWGLWLCWIAAQLVPLPAEGLAWLSPGAHERHAALAAVTGVAALNTTSLLPGATLDGLLLSAAYVALFWLVLVSAGGNPFRRRLMLSAVVFIGLAESLYAIAMTLSGWDYGFLERKSHGLGVATGTFVNRNHLAGYLELTLSAGIALILADLRPKSVPGWRARIAGLIELAMSRRARIRVTLVVMVIALVLTQSRMGNVAFFVSLLLCGCVYMALRHREVLGRSLLLFLSLILVDLLVISERYGLAKVAERIEQTDWETEQRAQAHMELQPVWREYWLTGSGLGTFAAAYSPHRSQQVRRYLDHAHNDHLEFLIEAGVFGYGLLVLIGAIVFVHGWRVVTRRRDAQACALGFVGPMALACLAIHGIADFNLRIPANAALLMTLIALSLGCSSRSRPRQGAVDAHPADQDVTQVTPRRQPATAVR